MKVTKWKTATPKSEREGGKGIQTHTQTAQQLNTVKASEALGLFIQVVMVVMTSEAFRKQKHWLVTLVMLQSKSSLQIQLQSSHSPGVNVQLVSVPNDKTGAPFSSLFPKDAEPEHLQLRR